MTHPLEQLAPYVDGALAPRERAVVDAHLRSCDRCQAEVAASARARAALRALPDVPVPDIAASFSPERVASSRPTPARGSSSPWAKVVPALAAAAVVALVALVAPRVGGGADEARTASDAGGVEATVPEEDALRLEIVDPDYDEASLQEEAAAFAGQLAGGQADQGAVGAEASAAPASEDAMRVAGAVPSARARDCLRTAFTGHPGELVRITRATFLGTPAYLGYVLESPGASQPATLLSIWVAAVGDCSILSISSADL